MLANEKMTTTRIRPSRRNLEPLRELVRLGSHFDEIKLALVAALNQAQFSDRLKALEMRQFPPSK